MPYNCSDLMILPYGCLLPAISCCPLTAAVLQNRLEGRAYTDPGDEGSIGGAFEDITMNSSTMFDGAAMGAELRGMKSSSVIGIGMDEGSEIGSVALNDTARFGTGAGSAAHKLGGSNDAIAATSSNLLSPRLV